MRTAFKTGNVVRANLTAQGMTQGNTYIVLEVLTQETPFGGFTTYIIADGNKELRVGNGHMLLTLVVR
jgi:hypothetical protein